MNCVPNLNTQCKRADFQQCNVNKTWTDCNNRSKCCSWTSNPCVPNLNTKCTKDKRSLCGRLIHEGNCNDNQECCSWLGAQPPGPKSPPPTNGVCWGAGPNDNNCRLFKDQSSCIDMTGCSWSPSGVVPQPSPMPPSGFGGYTCSVSGDLGVPTCILDPKSTQSLAKCQASCGPSKPKPKPKPDKQCGVFTCNDAANTLIWILIILASIIVVIMFIQAIIQRNGPFVNLHGGKKYN